MSVAQAAQVPMTWQEVPGAVAAPAAATQILPVAGPVPQSGVANGHLIRQHFDVEAQVVADDPDPELNGCKKKNPKKIKMN